MRAGAGRARFGPGTQVVVPATPDPLRYQLAKQSPIGLAGITVAPVKKFSILLDTGRCAINHTPISTRLGVNQKRLSGGLNFFFTPRTELHLEYFYGRYSTRPFDFVNPSPGQVIAANVLAGQPLGATPRAVAATPELILRRSALHRVNQADD